MNISQILIVVREVHRWLQMDSRIIPSTLQRISVNVFHHTYVVLIRYIGSSPPPSVTEALDNHCTHCPKFNVYREQMSGRVHFSVFSPHCFCLHGNRAISAHPYSFATMQELRKQSLHGCHTLTTLSDDGGYPLPPDAAELRQICSSTSA